VLEKLVASGRHRLLSLLIADNRLPGMADITARLDPGIPVFAAPQPVMDAVAGFPMHRGILGLGERRDLSAGELLAGLPAQAMVVGLSGIANHDNMGGLFRNAAAFGVDALLLDSTCCDPLYRKAIRVSVGAALIKPFARLAPGQDLARTLEGAGFTVWSLSPAGDLDLSEVQPTDRSAILFGAEGPGLPAEILARTRTVRLRMSDGFDSLNVATTSGIVLHRFNDHRSAGATRT
jgi:tRNA G18 (ribose-2'-O)-methylase SpoU